MIKGIIFDFDGVVAESVQVKTDAFMELYILYGQDVVQKVRKHHEFNGGMSRYEKIKYYHKTFLDITLTQEEIMQLANQFSKLVVDRVIKAPYVQGVLEYIIKNHKKYKLFISTGTPNGEINTILKERGIAKYFTGVYGSPDKKNIHLDHIMMSFNLKPDEIIFYGDSKTDLDAAQKMNVECILIKNQYNKNLFCNYNVKMIDNFISLL